MREYEEFMKRYSSLIKTNISYEEFNSFKEYITKYVKNNIGFYGYQNIDLNKCISFVMFCLLKNYTYSDIYKHGYENEIDAAIRYFNNASKKAMQQNKQPQKFNTAGSITYVQEYLEKIKDIFDKNVDLDELAKNIYEMLIFDGHSQIDVEKHNCDDVILDYIKDEYFNIKFTNEFKELKTQVANDTSSIFLRNKRSIAREDPEGIKHNQAYKYYDNPHYQRRVAFAAAVNFFLLKEKLGFEDDKLEDFINKYIEKDMIRSNSIIRKAKIENKANDFVRTMAKRDTEEEREARKKRAITIAIVIGAFILENLIYKVFEEDKDKSENYAQDYYYRETAYQEFMEKNGYDGYDYDNNEYTLRGDSSVKL